MNSKKGNSRCLIIVPFIVMFCFSLGLMTTAGAEMFVYPAKGQSKDQQNKDEYSCHQWAVQQTGFDPSKQQPVSSGKSSSGGGEVVKSGAVGALLGLGNRFSGRGGRSRSSHRSRRRCALWRDS